MGKNVEVTIGGGTKLLVPKEIAANETLLKDYVAEQRKILGIPKPDSNTPTNKRGSIANASLLDRGMEFVTSVNRATTGLADIATTPIQYGIQAARQGTLNPQGGSFFRSTVPERGEFAGDDYATKIIAGAGDLATLAIPSGMYARGLSNLISQASKLNPTTFQKVLQELGKTTVKQDVGYGLLSGAGGEAAVEMFGENDITRIAGQILTPVAWNATAGRLLNYTKNNFLINANPSYEELKGLKSTFFTMIDEAGASLDTPDVKPFIGKIDSIMKDYTLDGAGNSRVESVLNNLRKTADEGELTFSRLLNDIQQLKNIPYDSTEGKIAYNIAKDLDEDVFNWTPQFPEKLQGKTVQEVISTARELHRRDTNALILQNTLRSADLSVKSGKNVVETLKGKLKSLIDPDIGAYKGNWSDEETKLIETAMSGKGLQGIFNGLSTLGFNSDDLVRSIIYGAVFGGLAFNQGVTGTMALGGGMLTGTAFARAMNSFAASTMKRNVKLMQSTINAGENWQPIFSGYMKNTPKDQRDPRELASLFVHQRVPLLQLSEIAENSSSQLLKDSTVLAVGIENVLNKDSQQETEPGETNIAGVTRPIPNRPDASFTVQ